MFHFSRTPARVPRQDGPLIAATETEHDPVARCVQIGLMIYLSPVVLLVAIIGTASLAVQVATRIAHRQALDEVGGRLNDDDRDKGGLQANGAKRRVPALR